MSMVNIVLGKILVCNLNFYYGKFYVLKNINLDIIKNQVMVFIGLLGCGKFILLCMFNKMFELYLEQCVEGEILLDGDNILINIQDIVLLCVKVGMVFQKLMLFLMFIYDNIVFGVCLFEKLFCVDMDECVQWVLIKVVLWNEIKDKLYQSGYFFFGGQQQCLCIVCGIVICLEVLLFDELCFVLDLIFIGCIEELIIELKQDYIVVIVIYNMQQVVCCFDYMVFMYFGELIEFSNMDDLFIKFVKK